MRQFLIGLALTVWLCIPTNDGSFQLIEFWTGDGVSTDEIACMKAAFSGAFGSGAFCVNTSTGAITTR